MKTTADLEKLKEERNNMFRNNYEYFISTLATHYMSGSNDPEPIRQELKNWDEEAKSRIIEEVVTRVKGIRGDIDAGELAELLGK